MKALEHKKYLFFDLDDTVTHTRTPMEDDVYTLYRGLSIPLVVVSGATTRQIAHQTRNLPLFRLGQNGNHAESPDAAVLWDNRLHDEHTQAIYDHITRLRAEYAVSAHNEDDLVEHRGAQISFSLIGHNQSLDRKRACDPDRSLRTRLLEKVPLLHNDIEVKIGGTTCFDYFQKGRHKGYNIRTLINRMGWNADDCLYFGDALVPGGNDESVIGIIDTYPVKNHRETYDVLKGYYL